MDAFTLLNPVDRRRLRKSLRTDFSPGPKTRLKRGALRLRQASHWPALVAGARLERPIFVIGAPRAGTSLLYAILRSSSALAHWPGEAHEIWEADFHPALRGWDSNILDASDAEGKPGERIKRSFFLVAGPRRRLIDKTPRNCLRIRFVDALWPDARYIFLVRDGRDNVNSLINAWRTPRYRTYELPQPHAIPGVHPRWWKFVLYPGWRDDVQGPLEIVCARQWVASNEHALDALASTAVQRWTRVTYEELVAAPVATAERLMTWLQLPLERTVREKALALGATPVNVVTPPAAGKWRRENPDEVDRVADLLGSTMERLGYR
jgi:hypothetical protein